MAVKDKAAFEKTRPLDTADQYSTAAFWQADRKAKNSDRMLGIALKEHEVGEEVLSNVLNNPDISAINKTKAINNKACFPLLGKCLKENETPTTHSNPINKRKRQDQPSIKNESPSKQTKANCLLFKKPHMPTKKNGSGAVSQNTLNKFPAFVALSG